MTARRFVCWKNLTPALFEHFHTGKLAKWLRVRKLDEHAEKLEALLVAEKEHEAQLFKNMCEIFGQNLNDDEAREAIQNYKKLKIDVEIEQANELKIEQYENSHKELVKAVDEIYEIFDTTSKLSTLPMFSYLQLTKATEFGNKLQVKLKELKLILQKTTNLTD